jgi:hypothetical protein
MPIFINTDNSDKKHKIYDATLAGSSKDVEDKMREMVIKAFEKDSDYTTNTSENAKGYTLKFTITVFKASGGDSECTLEGEILRYPKAASKHGKHDENVNLNKNWKNSATVSGKGTPAAVQAVEAIMELMVPKSKPIMKIDWTRR